MDANRALGLPDDCREYTSVAAILQDLGVQSVALMTNNPRKVDALRALGIVVTHRIPCLVQAQADSVEYLRTKGRRMAHMMGPPSGGWPSTDSDDGGEAAPATASLDGGGYAGDGDFCYWEHGGEPMAPSAVAEAEG